MSDINKGTLSQERFKSDLTGLWLKVFGWLFILFVVGAIVCLVVGVLKAAISAILIVGAALGLIALFCLFLYERLKWKFHMLAYEHVKRRQAEQMDRFDNL